MAARQHLILIDGSGYIFRAFHALPPMSRPDGTPVNAVFGFTNMLARFIADHAGDRIAVIFDKGRRTFRNEIYPDYKAHRPDPPEELIPQFGLIREALQDSEAIRIRVRGNLPLFETLKEKLPEHANQLDFMESPDFDLSVSIDDSVYETRLAEWSLALSETLA